MTIKSQSLPFTRSLIEAAPDTVGVFALWQNGGVIYLGKACAGSATIRKALAEQFQARQWSWNGNLRCSWEVADDPDRRAVARQLDWIERQKGDLEKDAPK